MKLRMHSSIRSGHSSIRSGCSSIRSGVGGLGQKADSRSPSMLKSIIAKLSQAPAPAGLSWLYFRFLQPSNHPTTQPSNHPPNKVYFDKEQPYPIASFPLLATVASLLTSTPPSAQARLGFFYSKFFLCYLKLNSRG